ncbi:hypothetical protein AGMMS49991_06760 [Spirochaetia bacterium]|nr:hypothetical protein AGMMS49991_06760 [Spirochaetia bacterium]
MTLEDLEDLRATKRTLLLAIKDAAANGGVTSYSLSTPDGSQSTTRQTLYQLTQALKSVNALIAEAEQDISSGTGVHYSAMRRRF